MRRVPSLVSILFEQSEDNKEKGRESSREYKKIAGKVADELEKAKSTPGDMKAFLNGPAKDPKIRKLLSFGRGDGQPDDEKMSVSKTGIPVASLKPTQNEIEFGKSVGWPLANLKTMQKIVAGGTIAIGPSDNDSIVASGDLIIDGHHRWSSIFAINPGASVSAYDITMPTDDAGEVLALTQLAIGATLQGGEPVPDARAGGFNILGAGKDQIYDEIINHVDKTIESAAGPILGEEVVKQFISDGNISKYFGLKPDMSVEDAREKIAEKVSDNLSNLPGPAAGSPPRVDMPQLDKAEGGVQGVLSNIKQGSVNFEDPLLPGQQKESVNRRDNRIMERWQRLAGILKD